jgi:hypothetical protein
MKRWFLFVGVVLMGSMWSGTARAQYGLGGFGNTADVNQEIDAARSKIRQQMSKYGKPQARPSRTAVRGGTGSADRYGRVDLAGHPVAGYPAVRGDLNAGTSVSRGGANGKSRGRARRAK